MKKTNIDFMGARRYTFIISGILTITVLFSIFVFRGFNQGIDFSGGLTANLTINFEESDIGMLRELFANVRLEHRVGMSVQDRLLLAGDDEDGAEEAPAAVSGALVAGADGPNVFYENLGTSISSLETRKEDKKPWASETYIIRIKNMEGVDKDQIEAALTGILSANFAPTTRVSFSVSTRDPNDTGAGLDAFLQTMQMGGSIELSDMEIRDGETVTASRHFLVGKDFAALPFTEMEYRNGITRYLLANPNYTLEDAVEFTSTIDWGSFNSVSSTIGQELEK